MLRPSEERKEAAAELRLSPVLHSERKRTAFVKSEESEEFTYDGSVLGIFQPDSFRADLPDWLRQ